MARRLMALACVPVAALSFSALVNCGSSSSPAATSASTSSSGSGSGSTSSGATTLAAPPAVSPNAPAGSAATPTTIAISQLFLGDTTPCSPTASEVQCTATPAGTSSMPLGWKTIGYDLDGQDDTATTANHCKPAGGASQSALINGNNGIDNSFGKNVLPIILELYGTASTKVNQELLAGGFTIMFEINSLGTGTDYKSLDTSLFLGSTLTTAPKFDGTDNWPVSPSLLNPPMTALANGSQVEFKNAYTSGNTWVSGSKGNITLALSIAGITLNLPITDALISFEMDSAHKHATNGVIAGVLNTAMLVSQISSLAGSFDSSLCGSSAISGLLNDITAASDIGADGSQSPSETCSGISIGLGFNGDLIQNPTTVGPQPTAMPSPCGDGGTGSSSSSSSSGGTGGGDGGI